MVFAKGLADSGCWGDKLFGRLVSEELRGGGHGCSLRKASQAKVIYGLEPIFESGRTCIIKVSSLLVFGPSSETSLLGRNYDVTIQVLSHAPAPASTLSSPPLPSLVLLGSPIWRRMPTQSLLYLDESLRCSPGYIFGTIVFKLYFSAETFFTSLNCILHREALFVRGQGVTVGGAGAPLSAAWPLGYSHLSLGLQQTQFGNHFENMSKASCFTMRKMRCR